MVRGETYLIGRFFQAIGTFNEISGDHKSNDVTEDVAHCFRLSGRWLCHCIDQIFQLVEDDWCFREEKTRSE